MPIGDDDPNWLRLKAIMAAVAGKVGGAVLYDDGAEIALRPDLAAELAKPENAAAAHKPDVMRQENGRDVAARHARCQWPGLRFRRAAEWPDCLEAHSREGDGGESTSGESTSGRGRGSGGWRRKLVFRLYRPRDPESDRLGKVRGGCSSYKTHRVPARATR